MFMFCTVGISHNSWSCHTLTWSMCNLTLRPYCERADDSLFLSICVSQVCISSMVFVNCQYCVPTRLFWSIVAGRLKNNPSVVNGQLARYRSVCYCLRHFYHKRNNGKQTLECVNRVADPGIGFCHFLLYRLKTYNDAQTAQISYGCTDCLFVP